LTTVFTGAARKIDRILLVGYLIALLGLLLVPISSSGYRLLGIGADKWMHAALFAGLAVFLRWNLTALPRASTLTIGLALIIAVITELAQGLVDYRSAELQDVVADLLGAMLGTAMLNRVIRSEAPEVTIGLLAALMGLMVGGIFALADFIGVSSNRQFGTLQLLGTMLGMSIFLGGFLVYKRGMRRM